MQRIPVHASRSYDVVIDRGLLARSGKELREISEAETVMLVSDDLVFPLYGETVRRSLAAEGFRVCIFVFPHGEASKNLTVYGELLEALCAEHLTRSDLIAALGGGVTGDLAGFAAATYLRGIDYVQIPTSLLAAVDSSVGGKTAIDLRGGKNQAGCFYQPVLVLFDPDVLATLPEEEYRCGCAEVIKYAMIRDDRLFADLLHTPAADQAEHVAEVCVSSKRDIVLLDEYDRGERMLLNFGHTLGHAAELASGYSLKHGQAVAMGMSVITRAARVRGYCSAETETALTGLLRQYGLPTEMTCSAEDLLRGALSDKKLTGGDLHLIVPTQVGRCIIRTIPAEDLAGWIRDGGVQ